MILFANINNIKITTKTENKLEIKLLAKIKDKKIITIFLWIKFLLRILLGRKSKQI